MDQRPTQPQPLCIPIPTTSTPGGLTLGPGTGQDVALFHHLPFARMGHFIAGFFSAFHVINRLLIINFALAFY